MVPLALDFDNMTYQLPGSTDKTVYGNFHYRTQIRNEMRYGVVNCGQCKTQTPDCRLQTRSKMKTAGKIQTADFLTESCSTFKSNRCTDRLIITFSDMFTKIIPVF